MTDQEFQTAVLQNFQKLGERLQNVEGQLQSVEGRLENVEVGLQNQDGRLQSLEGSKRSPDGCFAESGSPIGEMVGCATVLAPYRALPDSAKLHPGYVSMASHDPTCGAFWLQ